MIKTIGVLTSGGDAPGMNAAVRAVVRAALKKGIKVYGIRRGYCGLIDGDIFEMNEMSVSNIIHKGGTILYTARSAEFRTEAGVEIAKKTCEKLGLEGLVVIGDVKRGDIGSTSEAYAVAHLGKVVVGEKSYAPFDEDFATVNPYLGSDGINPFIKVCKEEKKGIFVLVKTSNPSSGEFQDRLVDGRPLYEIVGEKVAEWGSECMGSEYSNVGAVVGATYPEMGKALRKVMPKSYILVPGYGAQGGKGADLVHFFNEDGLGAIVNSSRGIIAAYQQEKYAQFGAANYADASRQAVIDMREDIAQALQGRK